MSTENRLRIGLSTQNFHDMKNTSCIAMLTPVGDIRIVWTQKEKVRQVYRILLPEGGRQGNRLPDQTFSENAGQPHEDMDLLCLKIREYFEGGAVEFSLDRMDMGVCSVFQRQVYMQARRIPRGRVMSYGHLAESIGIPQGARAVGMALSRNPFPLVIPCHRVIRATGELGGFGGGLKLKKTLLEMEGTAFDPQGRVLRKCFFD